MNIWWCIRHDANEYWINRTPPIHPTVCVRWAMMLIQGKELGSCSMVEKQLCEKTSISEQQPNRQPVAT